MRRLAVLTIAIAAFAFVSAAAPAAAQSTFNIPFKFESGGKKFAAGSYVVTRTADGQISFQHATTGKETAVGVTEKLKAAEPPASQPQLVFDEVGNFEPSYTEYFTVYVLAEVWLSGQEGYLVHTTKGAHKNTVVK